MSNKRPDMCDDFWMMEDHTKCGCFGRSERLDRFRSNVIVGWADVVWRTKNFFLRFRPNYRSVFFAPRDIRQPKAQHELSDVIDNGEYRNGVFIGNGYTIYRDAEALEQCLADMERKAKGHVGKGESKVEDSDWMGPENGDKGSGIKNSDMMLTSESQRAENGTRTEHVNNDMNGCDVVIKGQAGNEVEKQS